MFSTSQNESAAHNFYLPQHSSSISIMGPYPVFHGSTISSSNTLVLSPEAWGQIPIVTNLKIHLKANRKVLITEPGKHAFECVADTDATYETLEDLLENCNQFTWTYPAEGGVVFTGKEVEN